MDGAGTQTAKLNYTYIFLRYITSYTQEMIKIVCVKTEEEDSLA